MDKKKRSQKQEKSVAKKFDAKTVIASGAFWNNKGDVRTGNCLIECKYTDKDYYSLSADVWEKIASEALRDRGRIPLMVIDVERDKRLVVFNPNDFQEGVPEPYECLEESSENKSYRIRHSFLEECTEEFGSYVYGKMFTICGKKRNVLCFMRVKDFLNTYQYEI